MNFSFKSLLLQFLVDSFETKLRSSYSLVGQSLHLLRLSFKNFKICILIFFTNLSIFIEIATVFSGFFGN